MRSLAQFSAALVVSAMLVGCSAHHKKPQPASVAMTAPPDLKQTPLYAPEMSKPDANLPPQLPAPAPPKAEPAPPPQPRPKRKHSQRRKSTSQKTATGAEVAGKTSAPAKAAGGGDAAAKMAAPSAAPAPGQAQSPAPAEEASMRTPGEAESPDSPIGELTAGTTENATETKRQAVELIQASHKGISDLKRALSPDEAKTVAQVKRFLDQAQKALDNGDIDGAYTLATKAKVLLDELTGGS